MIENQEYSDCEIRTFAFDYPNVILKLFDSTEIDFYSLMFLDVEYFIFESDHMQNVVSSLRVFGSISEALSDSAFKAFAERRSLVSELENLVGNKNVCYIRPITGGDTIIVFTELKRIEFDSRSAT